MELLIKFGIFQFVKYFMEEGKNSDIHLRPRFKFFFNEDKECLIEKFRSNLNNEACEYSSKIIDNHIVIDVPIKNNHFWSPQLNIEVEKVEVGKSIVKGLFGPKPQVWTLFMFLHFAIAVAFIGFSIMAYVKWTLNSDFMFPLVLVIVLPVLWIVMYFLGRIGKKTGHKQMDELHEFMMNTLKKN